MSHEQRSLTPEPRPSFGGDPLLAARLARARQTNRDAGKEQLVQEGASLGPLRKGLVAGRLSEGAASPYPFERANCSSDSDSSYGIVDASPPLATRRPPGREAGSGWAASAGRGADGVSPPSPVGRQATPPNPSPLTPSRTSNQARRGTGVSGVDSGVGSGGGSGGGVGNSVGSGGVSLGGEPAVPSADVGRSSPVMDACARSEEELQATEPLFRRLLAPAEPGCTVECLVRRERKAVARFWPTYRMYFQHADGDEFVLAARSKKKADGHSFRIYRSLKDCEKGVQHVAKLRSNFLGTEWVLYDAGCNPKKLPKGAAGAGALRRELALIQCQQNVVGSACPRRVRVTLPPLDADGLPDAKQPGTEADSLPARERNGELSDGHHLRLITKEPRLNPSTGRHSLNFNGRVTVGSVKNMQLVSDGTAEPIACQFGKVGKDEFTLDYSRPLTPLQAFGVAVASLAYKLASEGG